jgi:hypothetical protein
MTQYQENYRMHQPVTLSCGHVHIIAWASNRSPGSYLYCGPCGDVLRPPRLRAFRDDDGSEVVPGDVITDFRGGGAVFWCATRPTAGGRAGKIQTWDAHGPELYATSYGLHVVAG